MREENPHSFIEYEEIGKVKDKASGKEINQKFKTKVYSQKFGQEALDELQAIRKQLDTSLVKKESEETNYPPKTLSQAL